MPSLRLELLAASLLVACSSTPTPAGPDDESLGNGAGVARSVDEIRSSNLTAWKRSAALLAADAATQGHWVVFTDGEFRGSFEELHEAWEAAFDAEHALVFRPGIDDVDVTFPLSPFLNNDPRWTQLGTRLWGQFDLMIEAAGNVWHRRDDGRVLSMAWGDAGVRAELASFDGSKSVMTRTVPSGIFEQDLSLTEAQAEALGLGRIEVPGRAYYGSKKWPCRKVLLRVRIPALEIDVPAIGFVLPKELTDRMAMKVDRSELTLPGE